MVWHWKKFTGLFIIASVLLIAGLFFAWYPTSTIAGLEARLSQSALTQAERSAVQGSLDWWLVNRTTTYEPTSYLVIAPGIFVLLYAIVDFIFSTWQDSILAKLSEVERNSVSQAKLYKQAALNIQSKPTRATVRTNFPTVAGILTIIASCIVMLSSGIFVVGGILDISSRYATQDVNLLADGLFGILVSTLALIGGVLTLKRKSFAFAIIATCFMVVKGATLIIATGGEFWGVFIGMGILELEGLSLILALLSYKEFS
jgi:hypothetical protein